MRNLIYSLFVLLGFLACNSDTNTKDEASNKIEADVKMDNNLKDDTMGVIEKDTLPVIVKKGEKIED